MQRSTRISCSFLPRQSPPHSWKCSFLSDLGDAPLRPGCTVLISIKVHYQAHLVREGEQSHRGIIFDPEVFSSEKGRASLRGWYWKCQKGQWVDVLSQRTKRWCLFYAYIEIGWLIFFYISTRKTRVFSENKPDPLISLDWDIPRS